MAESTASKSYSSDPTLWLYTSLSSGSSQIVTATSRLETILKANRIPFKALDVATDEKARMIWGRRAGKRKLPGLVRMGMVIGDIDEIEEWNEYGELREQVGVDAPAAPAAVTKAPTATATATAATPAPAAPPLPAEKAETAPKASTTRPAATKTTSSITFAPEKPRSEQTNASGPGGAQSSMTLTMRQLGQEAAARAKQNKSDAIAARKAKVAAAAEESTNASDIKFSTESAAAANTTEAPDSVQPESTSSANVGSSEMSDEAATAKPTSIQSEGLPSSNTDAKAPESTPAEVSIASGTDAISSESPFLAPENPLEKPQEISDAQPDKSVDSLASASSVPLSAVDSASPPAGYTTHRGSSISAASKEEIKEIEEANKIPEEPEEEDSGGVSTAKVSKQTNIEKQAVSPDQQTDSTDKQTELNPVGSSGIDSKADADNTSGGTETHHSDDPHVTKTQEQAAAEPSQAAESVED